ncbi:hypothetical protein [Natrialba taiwanensis]|uniref:Uncharacterized protein n=1 Tax=Natrialba taiwanensis DSM 12281 TaxID=1230458 RepID=L9ZZE6_9EURY|nr:hypothetical protein [Natrialba taiwanensis]ELY91446.1 hypothetical protein C484_10476 [Natrialba taiwanensis DSM 12281]
MARYTLINHTEDRENDFDDKSNAENTKQLFEEKGDDVELVDNYRSDGGGAYAVDGADGSLIEEPEGDHQSPEPVKKPTRVEPGSIESEEQFVTQVKGVPDPFMVNMGTTQDKQIHIKKEGYYYLASQDGIDVQTEPLNPTWEGDAETSAWKATATKGDKEWSNVGTAHLEGEDMQGAEHNLDELASTRAACRVLSMATGAGVTSAEEMMEGDQ